MIFISVGTQFPFDRLISAMDDILDECDLDNNPIFNEIVAQVSNSDYEARNIKCQKYMEVAEFDKVYNRADIIISHAGMGNILKALDLGKCIIIFPRLEKFGEHRNDHQVDTANRLGHLTNVFVAYTIEELNKKFIENINETSGKPRDNNQRAKELIDNLKNYLSN